MMGRTQLNLKKFDVFLRCVVRLFFCNGNNFDEIKLGLIGLSFSLSLSLSFDIISFMTLQLQHFSSNEYHASLQIQVFFF